MSGSWVCMADGLPENLPLATSVETVPQEPAPCLATVIGPKSHHEVLKTQAGDRASSPCPTDGKWPQRLRAATFPDTCGERGREIQAQTRGRGYPSGIRHHSSSPWGPRAPPVLTASPSSKSCFRADGADRVRLLGGLVCLHLA